MSIPAFTAAFTAPSPRFNAVQRAFNAEVQRASTRLQRGSARFNAAVLRSFPPHPPSRIINNINIISLCRARELHEFTGFLGNSYGFGLEPEQQKGAA